MDALILTADEMVAHDAGPGHPERPERLRSIHSLLAAAPVEGTMTRVPRLAEPGQLSRVHDGRYVRQLLAMEADLEAGNRIQLDPDTAVGPGSLHAALLAAGAAVDAVDSVFAGDARRVFNLVRPPGHHAEASHAMGFCLFNNVAIAAEHALTHGGCERVLIVDWDVHHGNGTQHSFESRSEVLVANTHQYPFYPGTGALDETGTGEGAGATVNLPFPAGMGDADYACAYERVLLPIAHEFGPDLILVSAGFDADARDPLAAMELTADGFEHLARTLCQLADRVCSSRIIFTLEGGYDLGALTDGVRRCLLAMTDRPATADVVADSDPSPRGESIVEQHRAWHRKFWSI